MNRSASLLRTAALLAGAASLTACSHAVAAGAGKARQQAVLDFSTCAKPVWPADDLKVHNTGTVVLGFNVSETGAVADSRIVKSSGHPGLDEAARSGISKCRFKPATENGKAIAAAVNVQYIWTLE
jgi:D-alanyl-D-alanine endopeptidase (penicillin-binding protein 7)